MKKLSIALVLLVGLTGCATLRTGEAVARPDVFCQVRKPPAALLMGTWECYFTRGTQSNYVKLTLVKYGDRYGLHENRIFGPGPKRRVGWKDWIINGQEIIGVPEKYGVRMFVQEHEVFFTIRGLEHPVRMKRVK